MASCKLHMHKVFWHQQPKPKEMKKFIAAVLFLLMLACAALAQARHRPLPALDAGADLIKELQ